MHRTTRVESPTRDAAEAPPGADLVDPLAGHDLADGLHDPLRVPIQLQAGPGAAASPSAGASPLPEGVRGKMEGSFGADFSGVRVHEGGEASRLGAVAFTQGQDVHFAPGRLQPETTAGQELIGHELAHVVQQSQGRVAAPGQAKGGGIDADPGLEHEADVAGARAAQGRDAGIGAPGSATAAAAIQRKVGFELQSNWQIVAIGDNAHPDSKDVAYVGQYFRIEVDRGATPDLEIVTYPLANYAEVQACIAKLREVLGQLLEAQAGRGRFDIGPGNGWLKRTTIVGTIATGPTFKMQYTEGVTLDQIPALLMEHNPEAFRDLPETLAHGDEEHKGAAKGGRDPLDPESPNVRGMLAMMIAYLGEAQVYRDSGRDPEVKYAFTLLARTDFHAMYNSLDKAEKAEFLRAVHADPFHRFALDDRMFPEVRDRDLGGFTVRDWFASIVDGRRRAQLGSRRLVHEPKDLMSPPPDHMPHGQLAEERAAGRTQDFPYAMGLYGMVDGRALFEDRAPGGGAGLSMEQSIELMNEQLDGAARRDAEFGGDAAGGGADRRKRRKGRAGGKGAADDVEQYRPSPPQNAYLAAHALVLDWVEPDGNCILGAASRIAGLGLDAAVERVRDRLTNHAPTRATVTAHTHHTVADILWVLDDLETRWAADAADALPLAAAAALGITMTIVQPDGLVLPVLGGGPVVIRVNDPLEHYHCTAAAAPAAVHD